MFIFNDFQLSKNLYVPVLVAGMSLFQDVAAVTVTAGIDDNFAGGIEAAAPSAELASLVGVTVGFDGLPHNEAVAHTFTSLPVISSAVLELRVDGGFNPGVDTDGIFISFVDSMTVALVDDIAWGRTFGDFAGGGTVFADPDPGLVTPGVIWGPDSNAFISLDLSALPLIDGGTVDIIPLINNHGFLDVTVADDSVADFYRLTYNPTVVPLPPAALLFASGLLMLLGARKLRGPA